MNKLLIASLCMLPAFAFAQQNTFRVGMADITVHSQSPDLTTNGPAFLTPQPAGLTVGNKATPLLGYTRTLNDHFDVDLALGVPPRHNIYGRGTVAPFGVVAKVKQAAPTAFINYNFFSPDSRCRPFVGIGVNYTRFYDAVEQPSGELASGGPTHIGLTSSTGGALQAGFNYKLQGAWFAGGTVVAAKVKTTLTASTGSIDRVTTLDLRPVVYTVYVGYRF